MIFFLHIQAIGKEFPDLKLLTVLDAEEHFNDADTNQDGVCMILTEAFKARHGLPCTKLNKRKRKRSDSVPTKAPTPTEMSKG